MFLNNSIKPCHRSLVILKDTCNLFVSDVIAILEAIFFQGLQLFNSPLIREEICIHFWPLKSACGKLASSYFCTKLRQKTFTHLCCSMAIWHIFMQGIIKNMSNRKSQSNELERELYPSVVYKCKSKVQASSRRVK